MDERNNLVDEIIKKLKINCKDSEGVDSFGLNDAVISEEMERALRRRILNCLKELDSPVISLDQYREILNRCGRLNIELIENVFGFKNKILAEFLARYFVKSDYRTYLDISCYSENVVLYHPEQESMSISDYYRGKEWDVFQWHGSLTQIFTRSFGDMLFEKYREIDVISKNKNKGYLSLEVGERISKASKTIKGACITGGDELDLYLLRSNLPNFTWIPGSLEQLDNINADSKYDFILNLVQPDSVKCYAGIPLQKSSDYSIASMFSFVNSRLSDRGTFATLLHESNIIDQRCIDYIRETVKLSPIAILPLDYKVYLVLWKRDNGLTYSIDHYLFDDQSSSDIESGDKEIDGLLKKMKIKFELNTNHQAQLILDEQNQNASEGKGSPCEQEATTENPVDSETLPPIGNQCAQIYPGDGEIIYSYDQKIIEDLCSDGSNHAGAERISIKNLLPLSQKQVRNIYENMAPKDFKWINFNEIVQSIELGDTNKDENPIFILVTETMYKKHGILDQDKYTYLISAGEFVNPWDFDMEKCGNKYEYLFCDAQSYMESEKGNIWYENLQDSIIHISINTAIANPEYIKDYLGNKWGKIFLYLVRAKDIKGNFRIHNLMEAQILLPSLELQNQHVAKQKAIKQLKEYADDPQSIEMALNRLMDAFSNEIGEMERGEFEKICCEIRGLYPNLKGYFDGDGGVAIRSIVSGLWNAKRNIVDNVDCSGVILLVVKGLEVLLNTCFRRHLCLLLTQSPDIEIIRRSLSDAMRNEKDHNTMRWLLQLTKYDIPSGIPINMELGNMAYVCRKLYECEYTMGGAIVSSIRGLGSENSRLVFKMIRAVRAMFPNQGVVNRLRNGYVHEHLATRENMEEAIEKVKACLQKLNESIT